MMTGGIPILGHLHNIRYGWDMNAIKWDTVDGRNPAPVGRWFIHPIITPEDSYTYGEIPKFPPSKRIDDLQK